MACHTVPEKGPYSVSYHQRSLLTYLFTYLRIQNKLSFGINPPEQHLLLYKTKPLTALHTASLSVSYSYYLSSFSFAGFYVLRFCPDNNYVKSREFCQYR